ncbi:MAG: hypothetical protein PHT95_04900, partial [Candidatus Omnitrophica bacterium]|nr:hypothetical protein [Candidatus Omnitrophota bacterium]
GYITALAEGAYVYHKEQGSRRKLKDREEIYARNREIFEKRWDRLYRSFYMEYGSAGAAAIAESYELLKGLARRRIYVDMWVVRPESGKSFREKIFDSVIRHSDVTVRAVTGPLARARALWKILTKKKRYDLVIVEKGLLPVMLMFLGPLHGARLMIRDGMKLKCPDGREFDLSDPDEIARAVKDPQSAQ